MKTIGIIGGLGPQATMDFEARLHAAAQRLIPQQANSGYPPLLVYYHRSAPVIIDEYGHPILPMRPDPRLLAAVAGLGALVDFFVIPSNAPHYFKAQIEEATGRPILSMIDLTLAEVRRRGWQRVGVLGLGEPVVYLEPLARLGLAAESLTGPDRALRDRLDAAIIGLMAGQVDDASRGVAHEAVAVLRARKVDGIIPGCTEIPLLLGAAVDAPDLLNPAALLAEAAVRYAME